jgi:BirA family biotin operon repressor/biotin-[acetyl-CoA-carboxylase] ligase
MAARLDVSALAAAVQPLGHGWDLHVLDTVSSTNLLVKDAITRGAPEGYTVCALQQQAGYGRQGRTWVSPWGGLYVSLLLRPQVAPARLPSVGPALSFGIRQALAAASAAPDDVLIKWPNDVVCSEGKLCGMSCEQVAGALCIGIGINMFAPDQGLDVGGKNRPAYVAAHLAPSLRRALDGAPIDPSPRVSGNRLEDDQVRLLERMLVRVLDQVGQTYDVWRVGGFSALRASYRAHAALLGTSVTVENIAGTVLASGQVVDVDERGCLVLRDAAGALRPVASGEVHLR